MATDNMCWNGSTLTFNAVGLTPLTELSAPDEPADYDITGSADAAHAHGAGLHKHSVNASFLGSKAPVAGSIVNMVATVKGGTDTVATYAKSFISQMSVSGRKDGRIEGSLTAMPGTDDLTPIVFANTIGDLGFNGSTFSFAATPFTNIISVNYQSSATPVDSTGAEVATADTVYGPGIVDETLTVVTLGEAQAAAKAIGATVMAWKDGGTHGSWTNAKLMSVRPGGTLDGQKTTEHVFRVTRSTQTADN